MNAVAHCVEAFWGRRTSPLTDAVAAEGLRLLARGLQATLAAPTDPEAREAALLGAWLAAESSAAGSALHHRLCHVIGGLYNLPHAETHAVLLPFTTSFLAPAAPDAAARIAQALETDDAARGVADLAAVIGAPTSLAQLGMTSEQAHKTARIAVADLPDIPRRPTFDELRALLERAVAGSDLRVGTS